MSTRGRYGLRAVVDMARYYHDGPILLKDIARRQEVSMKYLDRIIKPLREEGLIKRVKKGYILTESPDKIDCSRVINLIEGSFAPVKCVDDYHICGRSETCPTIKVWSLLKKSIEETLKSIKLKDLVSERN